MHKATIIFDLDGTLVDTAPDLVTSLNATIALRGLTPVTYEDLTHLVGQGARMMIARAFALRGAALGEDDLDVLQAEFVHHYRAGMPGASRPYPGIVEALERLRDAGHTLTVCTNKLEELALPLLQGLGLAHHFAAITGGNTFEFRKPDPRHIVETAKRAGGPTDRIVMVGDSINDIAAARNGGIPSIAVTFGYSDIPVTDLGANAVIDDFALLTADYIANLTA
ncbi:HAD family hydrolase [Peteryoungia ipomoeae]|uniref:Phosphoglycolate phosphatase n=1 Tax=Peteryoungia ipomoeae TaxID=1210932 RepID=A0A4V4HN76_9HYPH|nr:HAD family hydrolase [Peteryoungia ipomoeae]THV24946.1 phosphoglycolate phosphatase [Peteryoungia ipomoeae]